MNTFNTGLDAEIEAIEKRAHEFINKGKKILEIVAILKSTPNEIKVHVKASPVQIIKTKSNKKARASRTSSDDIYKKLSATLKSHGPMSALQLGRMTHLLPSTVFRNLKKHPNFKKDAQAKWHFKPSNSNE